MPGWSRSHVHIIHISGPNGAADIRLVSAGCDGGGPAAATAAPALAPTGGQGLAARPWAELAG